MVSIGADSCTAWATFDAEKLEDVHILDLKVCRTDISDGVWCLAKRVMGGLFSIMSSAMEGVHRGIPRAWIVVAINDSCS